MRRHLIVFSLLVVFLTMGISPALVGASDLKPPKSQQAGQAIASPSQADSSTKIRNADITLRSSIAAAMDAEAKKRGLAIDLDTIAQSSRDDVTVANASVKDIQELSEEDFEKGANVAFVYLSLPSASGVPVGFYTMKAYIPKGSETGEAQLVDAAGKVVAKIGFRIEIPLGGIIVKPVLTIEIGFFYVCVDLHFRLFWIFRSPEIKLCLVW